MASRQTVQPRLLSGGDGQGPRGCWEIEPPRERRGRHMNQKEMP